MAADERAAIATKALRDIYERRTTYTDPVPWVLAPESRLLAAVQDQPGLAADILRAREGIAEHQVRLANARALTAEHEAALVDQRVKAAEKELTLIERRIDLAGQGVAVAQELVTQMKRWRDLADWGKWALTIMLGLAVVGVGVLMYFLGDDKVDGWEVALATFALALFVISPAVLLLRERPLKGVDQWMPGAKPEVPATEPKTEDKDSKAGNKKATVESAEDG